MAKISTLFPDWWRIDHWIKKKEWLSECIERKGDLKDTQCNRQNTELNDDLLKYLLLKIDWAKESENKLQPYQIF